MTAQQRHDAYRIPAQSFRFTHEVLQGDNLLSECFVLGSQLFILFAEFGNGLLELECEHILTVSAFASGSTVRRSSALLALIGFRSWFSIGTSHFDLYVASSAGKLSGTISLRGRC